MAESPRTREFVVGISGASGTRLALRFLARLGDRPEVRSIHLVVSEGGLLVARTEIDAPIRGARDLVDRLPAPVRERIRLHDDTALAAPIASGSYPVAGMAVIPCSAATLGAIASGAGRGLLHRAAEVTLKERRPLVLGLRESPFSLVLAENIRTVTLAGAVVAPPMPPEYLRLGDPDQWAEHWAMRYVDLLGLPSPESDLRWKAAPA